MRRLSAIAIAALLVLVGSAVAVASIPASDGTITGCRRNRTAVLRVINAEAGRKCRAGETKLTWTGGVLKVHQDRRDHRVILVQQVLRDRQVAQVPLSTFISATCSALRFLR